MEQCLNCSGYLFFKPMSNETFACCGSHRETVKDIDLGKGVSPAIERHGLKEIPCQKFKAGKSICSTPEKRPFLVHPIRQSGEDFLQETLGY